MRRTTLILGLLLVWSTVAAVPASAASGVTLDSDHHGTYYIDSREGFTLDCAGHSILPAEGEEFAGIWVIYSADVTIKNCVVEGFVDGIHLDGSSNSVVKDSELIGNKTGVVLAESHSNTVKHLDIAGRGEEGSFGVLGISSHGNRIVSVHAEGHFDQQFHFTGSNDNRLVGNTAVGGEGGYAILNGTGNTLSDNTASDYWNTGFTVSEESGGNTLRGNTAIGGGDGFALTQAEGNTLVDNLVIGANRGFRLWSGAQSNTLRANRVTEPRWTGFDIQPAGGPPSDANDLRDNTVTGGDIGFYLLEVNSTVLRGNRAIGSAFFGFSVDSDWVDPPATDNAFIGNSAIDYGTNGFNDATEGSGTAGTANTYTDNACSGPPPSSVPVGLC